MTGETIEKLVIKIQADIDQAQRDLDKMKSEVKGVDAQVGASSQSMAKAFTAVKVGVAAAAAAFGVLSVKAAAFSTSASEDIEQYVVSLNTLYGSQEAAAEQMQWILEFAKDTPFEVSGLVDSTVKLKAFGLEAQDVLGILGDTAASVGKPIDQAVNAYGKLYSGETGQGVMMFRDLGVNLKRDLDSLEWDAQGSLVTPLEEAMPLIDEYLSNRFGGMMEAQSQTAKGFKSNISDAFYQAGIAVTGFEKDTAIFRDGSLFDQFKDGLQGVLDTVDQIDFSEVGKSIESAFKTATGLIGDFARGFEDIDLSIFLDMLKMVALSLKTTFEAWDEMNVFEYIGKAIKLSTEPMADFYSFIKGYIIEGINLMIDGYNALVPTLEKIGLDVDAIQKISTEDGLSRYLKDVEEDANNTKKSIDGVTDAVNAVSAAASSSSSSSSIPDWAGHSDYRREMMGIEERQSTVWSGKDYFDNVTSTSNNVPRIKDIMNGSTLGVQTPQITTVNVPVTQSTADSGSQSNADVVAELQGIKEALKAEPRQVNSNIDVTVRNYSDVRHIGKTIAELAARNITYS